MKQILKRTNEYFVMGYFTDPDKTPQNNISAVDKTFIELNSDNLVKIMNLKSSNKFNFYNRFSAISGKTIGFLVNKFTFRKSDYNELCKIFNETKICPATTDERCYNSLKQIFSNDIGLYEQLKDISQWIEEIDDKNTVYVTIYDLKYSGGTSGISFGHNEIEKLPVIITERATEYIKSDKVIIKTGTLEKEMSGISSINFNLQPVNFVKDMLFVHKFCSFDPKSLVVSYQAVSKDMDDEGITIIDFVFLPLEADTFYKNKMMFESQNKFFDWVISAAKKPESSYDIMKSGLEIPMILESIEVTNNTFRNKDIKADDIITEIMDNLGFSDNKVIIEKISNSSNSRVKFLFSNKSNNDPKKYTECVFKAYL